MKQEKLERKGIYSPEEVYSVIKKHYMDEHRKSYVVFDGEEIKANSQRYQVFFNKGMTCVKCGLVGKYFALERMPDTNRYHLNLYAVNDEGEEILMTKDHILPKSKGGKNKLENYQCMCCRCNWTKGSQEEQSNYSE